MINIINKWLRVRIALIKQEKEKRGGKKGGILINQIKLSFILSFTHMLLQHTSIEHTTHRLIHLFSMFSFLINYNQFYVIERMCLLAIQHIVLLLYKRTSVLWMEIE